MCVVGGVSKLYTRSFIGLYFKVKAICLILTEVLGAGRWGMQQKGQVLSNGDVKILTSLKKGDFQKP